MATRSRDRDPIGVVAPQVVVIRGRRYQVKQDLDRHALWSMLHAHGSPNGLSDPRSKWSVFLRELEDNVQDRWTPRTGWLHVVLPKSERDQYIGDLLELHHKRVGTMSPTRLRLLWWVDALSTALSTFDWMKILSALERLVSLLSKIIKLTD